MSILVGAKTPQLTRGQFRKKKELPMISFLSANTQRMGSGGRILREGAPLREHVIFAETRQIDACEVLRIPVSITKAGVMALSQIGCLYTETPQRVGCHLRAGYPPFA